MSKILIVEDNKANMALVEFLLNSSGHQVFQAKDAETGLALARNEKPDLILMDIQLPGMDGLSAIRQLRQDPLIKAIKVMALTSFAMKGDEEKIMAAGFDDYLAKPIHHETFLQKIGQLLE